MKRFYHLKSFFILMLAIFAVVNGHAQTARILMVGDDWAEKILDYNVWGNILNYYGFSDVSVIGDTTAVSGTSAADWANNIPNPKDGNMPIRTYSLQNALLNNPTADIVYLSLGLNDILKNWKRGMLPQPGGNDDIFDMIQQNIQSVVDYILTIRPDVRIALADYDYINIYELAFEGIESAQELYIQMDYPSPLQLNQAFYELGLRKILISATRYRTEYIHSFGLQQYWYGHNGYYLKDTTVGEGENFTDIFFPPFPMNTTPYPGYPPSYAPLPGGDINYPSPISAMGDNGTDPIHLNEEGYRIIFENSLFQHIFDWLIDITPPIVVSIKRNPTASNPTRNSTLEFIVTFSEPVSTVTPADFTIDAPGFTGASIVSVTGSGTTRTVTVNRGTGNGNFSIDFLDRDTIVDDTWRILGNNLGVIFGSGNGNYTAGEYYTVDTSRPLVQITPTIPSPTTNDYTIFSVEFTEPVKGFTAEDITLTTSGNGSAQVTNFSGSGANYIFHLNVNRSSDFYVNVIINAGVCTDLVGNTNYGETYSNYLFQEPAFTINELYRSNGKLGDLILNSGDILTIYTGDQIYQPFYRVNGGLAISGRSVDIGGGDYAGKLDFQSIYVPSGVTVNVSGTNPLVISATKDITWNTTLDVSGTVPGRAGGGTGGSGGSGGAGGTGGAGGSNGGYGGAEAAGGAGGNDSNGGNGQNGTSNPGTAGESGFAGNPGEAGANGPNGQLGFGRQGTAGSGGTGGTAGGPSSQLANGGSAGSGGSIGTGSSAQNCANATTGGSGGNGSNGGNATITGASGLSGGNGSNGTHAEFTAPANNLNLAAGNGGGAGGGGGGGGGGQGGGQGGGGGSGGSGGGGGMARTNTCSQCGTSQNGYGGFGGAGGAGGRGGAGGQGGTASKGSNGGQGGNGGGCIVLAARGLLNFGGVIDISAGPPQNGGAVVPSNPGSSGINPGNNWDTGGNGFPGGSGIYGFLYGATCYPITVLGGNGGNGGRGGAGGVGSSGGASGLSGAGGNGGRGTPGMVKLHGTIVFAGTGSIACNNYTTLTDNIYRGRFTSISNMATPQNPAFLDNILFGIARNLTVLQAPRPYDPTEMGYLIPQLIGGPASGGFTEPDFWNKSLVVTPKNDLVELVVLEGSNSIFNLVKQIFIVNNGGADANDVVLNVSGENPYLIGTIPDGAIWTTTIPNSRTASIKVGMDITISPQNTEIHTGDTLTLNAQVVGGTGNKSYRWLKDGQEVAITAVPFLYIYNVTTQHTGVYTVEVTDSTHTESSDNSSTVVVYPAVNIVQSPMGGMFNKGDNLVLSVKATGGKGKLHYVWKRNNTSLSAPDMPYLLLSPAGPEDSGSYSVEVYDEIGTAPFGRVETGSIEIFVQNTLSVHGPCPVWVYEGTVAVPLVVIPSGGTPGYHYQWFKDENNNGELDTGEALTNSVKYNGVDTNTLTINNILLNDTGIYRCAVTDNDGTGTTIISPSGYLHVQEELTIILHPESTVRNPGQSVLFRVETSGGIQPLVYKWYGNSQGLLKTALQPSGKELALSNLTETNEDLYFVQIQDAGYRTVISNNAQLIIVDNPLTITTHPVGIHAYTDEFPTYTLSVGTEGGYGTIQFLWLRNGEPALGINNQPDYVFSPLAPELSGIYTCQVWDEVPDNTLVTDEAEILFAEHMTYTKNLEPVIFAPYNESLTLSVSLNGGMGNLSYQWWYDQGNGATEIGANTTVLELGYPTQEQDGEYYIISRDERESLQSNVCRVYVGEDLAITQNPSDVMLYTDEAEHFELNVETTDGFGTRQYTWYKDGEIVSEENTSPIYVSPSLDDSLSGDYYVRVRDAKDTLLSNIAHVLIGQRITITLQPQGGSITEGDTWTFSVAITGGLGDIHYQWKYQPNNSTEIYNIGDDAPQFIINDAALEDTGTYWVEISDNKSVITSNYCSLTVSKAIPAYNIGYLGILILLIGIISSIFISRRNLHKQSH